MEQELPPQCFSSARRILEIGTLGGYSTIWLARAVPNGGTVVTIEAEPLNASIARANLDRAGVGDRVDVRVGRAAEVLPTLAGDDPFDLVFIDADKENYVEYFELIKPRLKSGSVVLFDNVLWYGKVLEENPKQKSTQMIKQLNEMVAKDEDFENLILPLRDGVNLLRKK